MLRKLVLLVALLTIGCSPMVYSHGVPNLVEVGPGLWRSGQPTNDEVSWEYLRSFAGITDVVKLNFGSEGSDSSASFVGIEVHSIPIQPAGDKDVIVSFVGTFVHPDIATLDTIERLIEVLVSNGRIVLVHCTHGQDRTGLVVGRYRVLHDHWTKDVAYLEMRQNNFHASLHGLHDYWEDWRP